MDGTALTIPRGVLRECGAALFSPREILGKSTRVPLHELVLKTGNLATHELRKELFENVVLSGGLSLSPSVDGRLLSKLRRDLPNALPPRVIARPKREYAAWLGASILGSLTCCPGGFSVSKDEYDDEGPALLHERFYS